MATLAPSPQAISLVDSYAPPAVHVDWRRRLRAALVISDVLAVAAASVIALALRFGINHTATQSSHRFLPVGFAAAAMVPLWVIVLAAGGAYQRKVYGAGADEYRVVLTSGAALLAVIATLLYVFKLTLARGFVGAMLPLTVLLTIIGRFSIRQVLYRGRRKGRWVETVLLYGSSDSVMSIAKHLRRNEWSGLEIVGACVTDGGRVDDGIRRLGGADDLPVALTTSGAQAVAVTSEVRPGTLRRLAWALDGRLELLVVPAVTDVAGPRLTVRPVGGLPLLHVDKPELSGINKLLKGCCDRVGSALALLVAAPFFLITAASIKVFTRGPVFYRQVRVGRNGRPFTMLKFRTMVVGADAMQGDVSGLNEAAGPLFKIRDDPRVTKIGRFLRRFSLDELPQLLHVLSGKMSLVGPRPPLPSEVERYPTDVRRRLLVKPGLTGLWQVSGRSDLSWEEAVRLDLFYIDHWSLSMDLVVLLKTLIAVVARAGAY